MLLGGTVLLLEPFRDTVGGVGDGAAVFYVGDGVVVVGVFEEGGEVVDVADGEFYPEVAGGLWPGDEDEGGRPEEDAFGSGFELVELEVGDVVAVRVGLGVVGEGFCSGVVGGVGN